MVTGAALSWGMGNTVSKKIGEVNPSALVIWSSLIAWPPLLMIDLFMEGPKQIVQIFSGLSWVAWLGIFYISFAATLSAFSAWSFLLHRYRIGTIAPFSLLIPVFAILSSVLILNESLQSWKILAGAFVTLGLAIHLFGPRLSSRLHKF